MAAPPPKPARLVLANGRAAPLLVLLLCRALVLPLRIILLIAVPREDVICKSVRVVRVMRVCERRVG